MRKDDVNPAKNRTFGALVHVHCDLLDSRLLSRLRRPVGRFNAELLGVLGVQSLPAAELHRLGADDAADGSSAEKPIQNIEAMCQPAAPHEMKRRSMLCHSVRRVPPPKASSSHRISLYSSTLGASARVTFVSSGVGVPTQVSFTVSNRTQVPIGFKGRPLAQMRRVG